MRKPPAPVEELTETFALRLIKISAKYRREVWRENGRKLKIEPVGVLLTFSLTGKTRSN